MNSNKIDVYFDDAIFVLQKIGGISIVFGELIQRLRTKAELAVHVIISGKASSNLVFRDIQCGLDRQTEEVKVPRSILGFMPLMKRLPAGSIYHSTYHRYLYQKNVLKVLTVHDLGYERGIMRRGPARMIHLFFKNIAIRKADAIVCVSENTRKDLEYYYPNAVKGKLVRVIYNGLGEEFLKADKESTAFRHYILFVGARHPYKNLDKVIDAVAGLDDFELVIAGGRHLSASEQEHLERSLPGRFRALSRLDTNGLIELYRAAFCLVYPSSYEGFGLPVIEAMALGCPVIACNNSSLPEVAGDAALLIAEPSPGAISGAIHTLRDLRVRADLSERGRKQAEKFSWDTTVTELTQLYQELAKSK